MPRGSHWANWRERLVSGYAVAENGCHIWQRSKNNRGYGVIYFDGKLHLAHRASWLAAYGAMPAPGLVIDHICENKACINPAHLRELTNRENVLRSPLSPMNVFRDATVCRNGHAYTSNTPRNKVGHRVCQTCKANQRGGDSHTLVQS